MSLIAIVISIDRFHGKRYCEIMAGKTAKPTPSRPHTTTKPKAEKKARTAPRSVRKSRPDMPTPDEASARMDFVRNFIEQDFTNATGAYMRAYPRAKESAAATAASALLRDSKIQEALSKELAEVLKEKRRPLEKRILDTWLVRAFYDPTEILDLHGNLKITEKELRRRGLHVCIDSINKKLNNRGQSYLEYKLADRDKALDMLRQYIQMIEPPKTRVQVENITIGLPPKPAGAVEAMGLPGPPATLVEEYAMEREHRENDI